MKFWVRGLFFLFFFGGGDELIGILRYSKSSWWKVQLSYRGFELLEVELQIFSPTTRVCSLTCQLKFFHPVTAPNMPCDVLPTSRNLTPYFHSKQVAISNSSCKEYYTCAIKSLTILTKQLVKLY